MTLESELCNEADPDAELSPPGFPVAWVDIKSSTVSHTSKSYFGFFNLAEETSNISDLTTVTGENGTHSTIYWKESYQSYDVVLSGVYPYYLRARVCPRITSSNEYVSVVTRMTDQTNTAVKQLENQYNIPATVYFNGLASVEDVVNFIDKNNLRLEKFRFTGVNGNDFVRGQGTPQGNEQIPLDTIQSFIDGYTLLGIQSIDIMMDTSCLESITSDNLVLGVDISIYIALQNSGLSTDIFSEFQWYVEDSSWFQNCIG
jgi:hypothetical protein